MARRPKFRNRAALLKKMAALPSAVRSEIKQAMAESADELQDRMKALVPVQTGNLRDSISQTWGGGKVRYSSLSAEAGTEGDPDLTVTLSAGDDFARYAHIIEFGSQSHKNGGKFAGTQHPGTKAQPFFFPPYRALKKRIKSRIARATTRAAKRVAAGQS